MKTAAARSSLHAPLAPLPATVAEIGQMHFEGNIIPHLWYQHITLESGKPDLPAITILAEIVYWYRPYQLLDQRGKPFLHKRFDSDMFQCTAAYFEAKFGLTKDQARKALKRLEDAGYIRREYRDIVQQGILRNCIMFIEPVPLAILAITHPEAAAEIIPLSINTPSPVGDPPSPVGDPPSPVGDPPSPVGDPPSPVGDLIKGIKITTETSAEVTTTTTPNPSSTDARAAGAASAPGGGSSEKDEKPQDPDPNHGDSPQQPDEEKKVSREVVQSTSTTGEDSNTPTGESKTVNGEDWIDGQPPELIYPTKLTRQEQEDITQQICGLPARVAQQMLDVLESRIRSGQIRTNPAAVLRGIVRKHQTDPGAFDPSSGFQIAAQRRRQAEIEAHQRQAEEAHLRRLEEATAALHAARQRSRERSEGQRQFVRDAMEAIRGSHLS